MSTPYDTPTLSTAKETADRISTFIEQRVAAADSEGVVVGLSGGIDSTVAATVAVEALGSERVTGLLLPASATPRENRRDARRVAEELVIDHRVVDIQPLLDVTCRLLEPVSETGRSSTQPDGTDRTNRFETDFRTDPVGNAAARLRMLALYYVANANNLLVLGTGNRTELLLGYVTKYGDGAADLLPIGDLYKSQVRSFGIHLGVPDRILDKPPTAGLWAGQTDRSELGASYGLVDAILVNLVDEERDVEETAARTGTDPEFVRQLLARHRETAHKRRVPPTPFEIEQ